MKVNAAWYNRLLSNREMIAQQLDAMAFIMEDCAKDYEDLTLQEKKYAVAGAFFSKKTGAFLSVISICIKNKMGDCNWLQRYGQKRAVSRSRNIGKQSAVEWERR